MKRLLEAFALFVSDHPDFDDADSQTIAELLKRIMEADPEKLVMRQALEYYANESNWVYESVNADGDAVLGMDLNEASTVAKYALENSSRVQREVLSLMVQNEPSETVFKKVVNH